MDVGQCIGEIRLTSAEGAAVMLSDLVDRTTVVHLLRYYG